MKMIASKSCNAKSSKSPAANPNTKPITEGTKILAISSSCSSDQ